MILIFKKYKLSFIFIILLTLFVSISELSIMFLLPQLYNVSVGNEASHFAEYANRYKCYDNYFNGNAVILKTLLLFFS